MFRNLCCWISPIGSIRPKTSELHFPITRFWFEREGIQDCMGWDAFPITLRKSNHASDTEFQIKRFKCSFFFIPLAFYSFDLNRDTSSSNPLLLPIEILILISSSRPLKSWLNRKSSQKRQIALCNMSNFNKEILCL